MPKASNGGRTTPAKKTKKEDLPSPDEVSSAAGWKNKRTEAGGSPLRLPSGNVALVTNPGMKSFVSKGLIPNSLLPIVTEALSTGKPPGALASELGAKIDTKMLVDMLDLQDRILCEVVLEPMVSMPPERGEPRDENVLYVDEVDDADKAFIFQWAVGGTRDLETFRREHAAQLAAS